tara:strand:- start:292 stop:513 length:222 start_codon:yes stop_codon:yes gene_type:complete
MKCFFLVVSLLSTTTFAHGDETLAVPPAAEPPKASRKLVAFENVTQETGIMGSGSTAAWADYDNDGFLDLYMI